MSIFTRFRDIVNSNINGMLSNVADFDTSIPGGVGTFTDFGGSSIDNESIVLNAFGSSGQQGLYTTLGGAGLREIIDLNDEIFFRHKLN